MKMTKITKTEEKKIKAIFKEILKKEAIEDAAHLMKDAFFYENEELFWEEFINKN